MIADVVGSHIAYYAVAWGFGERFEAKVAAELSEFLNRYDASRDLLLSATSDDDGFLGAITIDGIEGRSAQGAHLRWFIAADAARGSGLGRRLMTEAVGFSDAQHYSRIYLTTFPGLDAARHIYEQFGFQLVSETADDEWHGGVGEQLFERLRPGTGQTAD